MNNAASTWWLSIARFPYVCLDCGATIVKDAPCVYRHAPRMILCTLCAGPDRRGIKPTPSRTYLAARGAPA